VSTHPLKLVVFAVSLSWSAGAAGAHAQQVADPGEPGIWIADADGSLRHVPPVSRSVLRPVQSNGAAPLQLVFTVESFAQSATGALAAAQLAITRVRHAVGATGVGAAEDEPELAYVEPRYERKLLAGTWEKPRRLGFDAAYLVTVRVGDPARTGLLVDAAMGAGATGVLSVASEQSP